MESDCIVVEKNLVASRQVLEMIPKRVLGPQFRMARGHCTSKSGKLIAYCTNQASMSRSSLLTVAFQVRTAFLDIGR